MIVLSSFAYAGSCDTTYLDTNVVTAYLLDETSTTYSDDAGTVDLTSGTAPTRVDVSATLNQTYGQDFDGSDEVYSALDTSLKNDPFSVCWWHRPDSIHATANLGIMSYQSAVTGPGWRLTSHKSDGAVTFDVYDGSANRDGSYNSGSFVAGTWYHVCAVWDGSDTAVYVKGRSNTQYQDAHNSMSYPASEEFYLGNVEHTYNTADNTYSDVVLFDVALNSTCRSYVRNNAYPYVVSNTSAIVVTHISPANNTHNDSDLIVQYNVTHKANCTLIVNGTIRDTDTNIAADTTQSMTFNQISGNGEYVYYVNCTRSDANNGVSETNHWVYDTIDPYIYIYSPADDDSTDINGSRWLKLNVSCQDSNLDEAGLTIWNASDYVMFHSNATSLYQNLTTYSWTNNITMSSWQPGRYTLGVECADAHTNGPLHGLMQEIQSKGVRFFTQDSEIDFWLDMGYINAGGDFKQVTEAQITNFNIVFNITNATGEYKWDMAFDRPALDYKFGFLIKKRPNLYLRDASIAHFTYKKWYLDFEDWVFTGFPVNVAQNATHYFVWTNTGYCPVATGERCLLDPAIGGLNIAKQNVTFDVQTNITIKVNDTNTGLFLGNFTGFVGSNSQFTNTTNVTLWVDANANHTIGANVSGYVVTSRTKQINESPAVVILQAVSAGLQLTFYDEETNTVMSGKTVTINFVGVNVSQEFTTTSGVKSISGLANGVYDVVYSSPGYITRSRETTLVNSTIQYFNLYLLNSTLGDNVLISLYDTFGKTLEEYQFLLYRLIAGSYTEVERTRTNYDGKTDVAARLNTPFYKWVIQKDNTTYLITNETKIYSADPGVSFFINIQSDYTERYRKAANMDYSFSFNNATNNFILTYNDPSGSLTSVCLYVSAKSNYLDNSQYNNSCSSSPSGTLTVGVEPVNGTTYTGKFYTSFPPSQYIEALIHEFPESPVTMGFIGVILTFFICLTVAMIGLWYPPIAFVLVAFALWATKILNFHELGTATLTAITAAFFIGAWVVGVRTHGV